MTEPRDAHMRLRSISVTCNAISRMGVSRDAAARWLASLWRTWPAPRNRGVVLTATDCGCLAAAGCTAHAFAAHHAMARRAEEFAASLTPEQQEALREMSELQEQGVGLN